MLYTTTIISGFVALCEWSETRQWNSSAYTGNTEQVCSKFLFWNINENKIQYWI